MLPGDKGLAQKAWPQKTNQEWKGRVPRGLREIRDDSNGNGLERAMQTDSRSGQSLKEELAPSSHGEPKQKQARIARVEMSSDPLSELHFDARRSTHP